MLIVSANAFTALKYRRYKVFERILTSQIYVRCAARFLQALINCKTGLQRHKTKNKQNNHTFFDVPAAVLNQFGNWLGRCDWGDWP
jgi:hypothetical protein